MRGWVVVAEHPFYVMTDVAGEFTLRGLPPGRYTLRHGRSGSARSRRRSSWATRTRPPSRWRCPPASRAGGNHAPRVGHRANAAARGGVARLAAGRPRTGGGADPRVGPRQAPRRLPPHHPPLHRDDRGEPPDPHRDRPPDEPPRRGPRARRLVAADRASARDADALHRHGAPVQG